MTTNATIDSKLVRAIADEQLANNVFMIEWLVKAQTTVISSTKTD